MEAPNPCLYHAGYLLIEILNEQSRLTVFVDLHVEEHQRASPKASAGHDPRAWHAAFPFEWQV